MPFLDLDLEWNFFPFPFLALAAKAVGNMMQCVVLDGNLLDEVFLDGHLLDELPMISNLCVKYVRMMYLQIISEVIEERNSSKCQNNDKYGMSQSIRGFVKAE